jgi:hypothetical protein
MNYNNTRYYYGNTVIHSDYGVVEYIQYSNWLYGRIVVNMISVVEPVKSVESPLFKQCAFMSGLGLIISGMISIQLN